MGDVNTRADVILLQNVFESLAVGHGAPTMVHFD